jgi:hypothetical protein
MSNNEKLAYFLNWWAESLLDPRAPHFEGVSICCQIGGQKEVLVVSGTDTGGFDYTHEPIHHFFHHTAWSEMGPYTKFQYEECPSDSGENVQQDQHGGVGKNHSPRHRAGHKQGR